MNEKLLTMESFFLALSDRTRLRIFNLLCGGDEVCVGDFITALQEPQSKISRHLAFLRELQVVETTRRGKQIFYKISQGNADNFVKLIGAVQSYLADDRQMSQDRARFAKLTPVFDKENSVKQTFASADILPDEELFVKKNRNDLPVFCFDAELLSGGYGQLRQLFLQQ